MDYRKIYTDIAVYHSVSAEITQGQRLADLDATDRAAFNRGKEAAKRFKIQATEPISSGSPVPSLPKGALWEKVASAGYTAGTEKFQRIAVYSK